jgi:hypothetical protein
MDSDYSGKDQSKMDDEQGSISGNLHMFCFKCALSLHHGSGTISLLRWREFGEFHPRRSAPKGGRPI